MTCSIAEKKFKIKYNQSFKTFSQANLLLVWVTITTEPENKNHEITFLWQILELEQDKRDLERQVNELKARCEQIEKRAAELRQVEEKKHAEELQFLKRTNAQLKVNVSEVIHWCNPVWAAVFAHSIERSF